MSKVKAVLVVCVAALALNAIAAESASANWFVGGTELKEGEEISLESKATTALVSFNVPVLGVRISCNATPNTIMQIAAAIASRNVLRISRLIWRFCSVVNPAKGCELAHENAEIETLPLNGLVALGSKSPDDRVLFLPSTKNLVADITFSEANTCALAGVEPLTGSFRMDMLVGQTENVTQQLEGLGSVENNSLQLAGDKAYVEGGKALLKLVSGSKWSFR